jgi:hypothetical protein
VNTEETIQFLLERQASFQAEMEQLRDLTAQLARQQLAHAEQFSEFRGEMSGAVLALAQAQKAAADRIRETAELGGHTDDRLNTLIRIMDVLIRREGNGTPQS